MTDKERAIFVRALYCFGPCHQKNKLLEEMAELQVEILHDNIGRGDLEAIAEEMADVQILLDQMSLLFQNAGLQQQIRERKVERLCEMIFQEEYPVTTEAGTGGAPWK